MIETAQTRDSRLSPARRGVHLLFGAGYQQVLERLYPPRHVTAAGPSKRPAEHQRPFERILGLFDFDRLKADDQHGRIRLADMGDADLFRGLHLGTGDRRQRDADHRTIRVGGTDNEMLTVGGADHVLRSTQFLLHFIETLNITQSQSWYRHEPIILLAHCLFLPPSLYRHRRIGASGTAAKTASERAAP